MKRFMLLLLIFFVVSIGGLVETLPYTDLKGHLANINSVVFSPDGKLLASGSDDDTIRLWDAHTGGLKNTLIEHSGNVI